jgi:hypothetical protein
MAKAATKKPTKKAAAKPAAKKPAVPNMFAKAGSASKAETPAPSKGTTFALPKDLNEAGELQGSSLDQNMAITAIAAAKLEQKAATNKGNLAKGLLNPWALTRWAQEYAKLGVSPPGPVSIVNHNGEACTYVLQDKTQVNTLKADQVEMIGALLGPDAANRVIEESTVYSFDGSTMKAPAGEVPEGTSVEAAAEMATVQSVVFEIVSETLMADPRLTDDQKASLINAKSVTKLRPGTLDRLAEFCGSDAVKIEQMMEALGSGVPRYLLA